MCRYSKGRLQRRGLRSITNLKLLIMRFYALIKIYEPNTLESERESVNLRSLSRCLSMRYLQKV